MDDIGLDECRQAGAGGAGGSGSINVASEAQRERFSRQSEAASSSGSINAASATMRDRDPYDIGDALHQLAEKYAAPSHEHQLLRNAGILIGSLLSEKHRAGSRAVAAEAERDRADARVKLARLALG